MSTPTVNMQRLKNLREFNGLLSDRVYAAIKAAILSFDFEPGAVLRKGPICDALGVSRTPVSDAIIKLEADRLVEVFPQSSTRVAKMSMKEIREDAFLREALEVAAVEYTALHRSDELLARLNRSLRLQDLQVEDNDYEELFKADQEFHRLILGCCHIDRLHATVGLVSNHMDRARRLLLPVPGRSSDSVIEHRRIYKAIKASDPDAARIAMQNHLRQLIKRLEPLEKQRPELFVP